MDVSRAECLCICLCLCVQPLGSCYLRCSCSLYNACVCVRAPARVSRSAHTSTTVSVCIFSKKPCCLTCFNSARTYACACVRVHVQPGSTASALKSSGLSTAPLLPVCQARGYCRQVRGVSSPSVHPFGKFSKSKPVLEGTRSPRTLPRLSPPPMPLLPSVNYIHPRNAL